jgi:HSP20 family protein
VKLVEGGLLIKGEKKLEKEEKETGYVMSERSFGTFERYFGLPKGIDLDKIAATFVNGILTVRLPKSLEARKQERTIAVKAA